MIYVPIGSDCTVARILKATGVRTQSLPFDWLVSYTYANTFRHNFTDFETRTDLLAPHGLPPERRLDRLRNILDGTEPVTFIRKSHSEHHHLEYPYQEYQELKEAQDLMNYLSSTYPNLKYQVLVYLTCDVCGGYEYNTNNLIVKRLYGQLSLDIPNPGMYAYADVVERELISLLTKDRDASILYPNL